MTNETISKIIGAVVALALLGAAAFFWTQGGRDQAAGLITAALGLVALVIRSPLERRGKPAGRPNGSGPPPAGGTALLVLALVLSAVTQGCGASAVSMHARAAIGTAGVLAAAGTVADEARRQALDRVEAEHPTDPEHDAALIAEAARWRPAGATLDMARSAQLSWVAAVQAAHLAGGGAGLIPSLTPLAGRVAWLYAEAVRLFASLGTDLPTAPAVLLSLGGAR